MNKGRNFINSKTVNKTSNNTTIEEEIEKSPQKKRPKSREDQRIIQSVNVFGKPGVLIKNNPNYESHDLEKPEYVNTYDGKIKNSLKSRNASV